MAELAPIYKTLTKTTECIFNPTTNEFKIVSPMAQFNLSKCPNHKTKIEIFNDPSCNSTKNVYGTIEQTYSVDKLQTIAKFTTENESTFTAKNSTLIPNGQIKFVAKSNKTGELSLFHRNQYFSTALDVLRKPDGNCGIVPSAAFKYKQFVAGFRANLSPTNKCTEMLQDYSAALSYQKNNFVYSLLTKDKLAKVQADILYKVCSDSKIGVTFLTNLKTSPKINESYAAIGADIDYNKNLNIKAQLNTFGQLSAAITKKLSNNAKVTLHSRVNQADLSQPTRCGIRFSVCEDYGSDRSGSCCSAKV